ncbi:hypothetical protein VTJ04DRAFT_6330 [Mycothermus thermophilus]|uniref:uncharacterized protein n=1 Tax=Humicola insolens TaxID=85995 RepID=UPI0037437D42
MPPRRRQPGTSGTSSSTAAGSSSLRSSTRQSKLAKEHNITAEEEAEIREAFSLFAEPMESEKEGVIPIGDVRRALIALGIPPKSQSQLASFKRVLDPHDEGFATFPAFLGICALQINARRASAADDPEYEEQHRAELDEAYALFTTATGGDASAPRITLADLKRVAALLRLDQDSKEREKQEQGHKYQQQDGRRKGDLDGVVVTEEVLKDMILEANGGAGVARGVTKEEFDRVMRRAGVWR